MGLAKAIVDVNWADAGIAWGWPGVAGVLFAIAVISAVLIAFRYFGKKD